ncbi:MAG: hypothetical protein JW856_01405, partial [Dehalococcoidales bacterium]|nr:hypothetical protein [Dehalococcoidales bacterium]
QAEKASQLARNSAKIAMEAADRAIILTQQATEEAVNTWMQVFAESVAGFLKSERLATGIAESMEKQTRTVRRGEEAESKKSGKGTEQSGQKNVQSGDRRGPTEFRRMVEDRLNFLSDMYESNKDVPGQPDEPQKGK